MADDVCCEAKLSSSDKSNEQYKKYATTMYAIKNQSRLNTNTNTEQGSTNKIEENTHNVFKVFFYFHHYFNLVA